MKTIICPECKGRNKKMIWDENKIIGDKEDNMLCLTYYCRTCSNVWTEIFQHLGRYREENMMFGYKEDDS